MLTKLINIKKWTFIHSLSLILEDGMNAEISVRDWETYDDSRLNSESMFSLERGMWFALSRANCAPWGQGHPTVMLSKT